MNFSSKNTIATSILIGLTATTITPAIAAPTPTQIWSCRAESSTRIYIVDQLDRNGPGFDMAIFSKDKGDDRDYLGTIAITAQTNPDYIGKGVTNNSNIEVNAFGRGPAFNISDSKAGTASGRCNVNWQMADSQTRRLVRQCLASASQSSDGNIPEVTRFACTNDPAKGAAVEAMIPAGWTLEKQTSGDLNSDRQADAALMLVQSKTGQRALLVLLATSSGWEQLAWAPKLLLCQKCGGTMGMFGSSEHITTKIEGGVLAVEQYSGSRDVIHTTHRFWIDQPSKKLVCIGEDIHPYDRANGNKLTDSRNFLTGKRIVDETIVSNSAPYKPGHRTQEFKVSKELRAIESIDIEAVKQNALGLIPLDQPLK
jgi:hypothetical protein